MTTANFDMNTLHADDNAIQGAQNVLGNPKAALTHKDNDVFFKNVYAFAAAHIAANTPGGWAKIASMTADKVDAKVKTFLAENGKADKADNKNFRSGYRRPVMAMAFAANAALNGDDDAVRLMAAKLPAEAWKKMGTAVENAAADDETSVTSVDLAQIGIEAQDKANERAAAKKPKAESISKGAIKEALETLAVMHQQLGAKRGQGVTFDAQAEKLYDDMSEKLDALRRKLEG